MAEPTNAEIYEAVDRRTGGPVSLRHALNTWEHLSEEQRKEWLRDVSGEPATMEDMSQVISQADDVNENIQEDNQ